MLDTNSPVALNQTCCDWDDSIIDFSFELPQSSVFIRHAEMKDCDALHQLLTDPAVAFWTVDLPFVPVARTEQKILVESDDHYMLVAIDRNDEILGALGIALNPNIRMRHVAKIGPVVVHPAMKGKGIGSRLMEEAIDLADNWLNVHRLELLVYAHNHAAIALYKKFGFSVEGTLRHFAFQAGQYTNAQILARLREVAS